MPPLRSPHAPAPPAKAALPGVARVARFARFASLGAVLSGALVAGSASADIFQYTDADGVMHFTNRPARGAAGKELGAKLFIKSDVTGRDGKSAPGFAPQDRDPSRFTRYDDVIRQAATLFQIPEPLVRAVIKVESDYDPRAVSYAGARGLMQLMPGTADHLQVKDIADPRENIFGGVKYLRILANNFNGDLELTVAGYNAGEEAVMRYGGIPPYAQTRDYVTKVIRYYRRYRTIADPAEASLAD